MALTLTMGPKHFVVNGGYELAESSLMSDPQLSSVLRNLSTQKSSITQNYIFVLLKPNVIDV